MGTNAEILLVDRSEHDARRVVRFLEQTDREFTVERVSQLQEAKVRLSVHHYDAILVNPVDPADGSRIVAQLHASDRDAAIVVLRRKSDQWALSQAIDHGAQALVDHERLDADELKDVIRQAIARQQYQRVAERAQTVASGTSDALRNVVESLPIGVIVHEHGNLLLINAAAARIARATGTCLWRDGAALQRARTGLIQVYLGAQAYGLRIHDRPTPWRNRRARLMTLHLIEIDENDKMPRADSNEQPLRGSVQALFWHHHRLQDLWQRLWPVLEVRRHGARRVEELAAEFESDDLLSELDRFDARLRSCPEQTVEPRGRTVEERSGAVSPPRARRSGTSGSA